MDEAVNISAMLSTAVGGMGGGGAVILMAKIYLERTMKDLDEVVYSMKQVQQELAAITVKLDKIEKNDEIVRRHDRQIAAIESKVFKNQFEIKY